MKFVYHAAHAMGLNGGTLEIDLTDVELDSVFCSSHPEIQPGVYQRLTVTDTGTG